MIRSNSSPAVLTYSDDEDCEYLRAPTSTHTTVVPTHILMRTSSVVTLGRPLAVVCPSDAPELLVVGAAVIAITGFEHLLVLLWQQLRGRGTTEPTHLARHHPIQPEPPSNGPHGLPRGQSSSQPQGLVSCYRPHVPSAQEVVQGRAYRVLSPLFGLWTQDQDLRELW